MLGAKVCVIARDGAAVCNSLWSCVFLDRGEETCSAMQDCLACVQAEHLPRLL